MRNLLIAAILFAAPIIAVIAMNPTPAKECLKDAQEWAEKTFPKPKPKKNFRRRRG